MALRLRLEGDIVTDVATGVGGVGVGVGGVVGELSPPQELRSTANNKIGRAARRNTPQEGCFSSHIPYLMLTNCDLEGALWC